MRIHAVVNHGGFQWRAPIKWSHSSWHTPVVCIMITWRSLTMVWTDSHPTACLLLLVLLSVLQRILKCVSWVLFLGAALAASHWTNWCLRSCCVPISDVFDEASANRLDMDLLWPAWDGCVLMICWCGIGEEDDNNKKWEALRII